MIASIDGVVTAVTAESAVIKAAGVKVESAELTMQPKSTVEVEGNQVRQNLRLVDLLEDHDDVQRVTANFEIPDDVLAEAMA